MQALFNLALWLLIASAFGGVFGLVATFGVGENPSGILGVIVQVWAEKGWLLPYTSVGAVILGGIYFAQASRNGKAGE